MRSDVLVFSGPREKEILQAVSDRLQSSTENEDFDKGSYVLMGPQVLSKIPHPSTLASP